jgi:hypothetical protein
MKKFLLPVIVMAATLGTSGVYAQSKLFEGFGAYASTGYNQYKVEASNSSTSGLPNDSQTPAAGAINLGLDYTWAFGTDKRLGLAFEANPVNSSTASGTATLGNFSTKVKNYYQVTVNPGVLLQKDLLAYGKVGYFSATASYEGSYSGESTQNGTVFGAGLKKQMDGSWYLYGEFNARSGKANNMSFLGQTSEIRLGGYSALFGIGTNF